MNLNNGPGNIAKSGAKVGFIFWISNIGFGIKVGGLIKGKIVYLSINTFDMKEATLKIDLHDKIEHANPNQLKELYGLITNYFNSKTDITEGWDSLSEFQKERLTKSMEQANAGLGTPVKDVIKRTREEYGLNG